MARTDFWGHSLNSVQKCDSVLSKGHISHNVSISELLHYSLCTLDNSLTLAAINVSI